MLVDDITITIKAGKGGDGAATLKRNAQTPKGGPDGGNGGNGGNVYFVGTNDINGLAQFRYKKRLEAEDGVKGGKQNLYGRNGEHLYIKVPVGTRITDIDNKRIYEIEDEATLFLAARGGAGGRGNNEFKSATNQTPRYAETGGDGEEQRAHLELRLIADMGLIGLPNAGKSSLLEALTNAHPKIGNYSFTTLEPNLGVMQGLVLADIPGLIEGASEGRGLGTKFLKHIERTKLLLHCIDASSEDLLGTYETVRKEFAAYNPALLEKQEVILLTKIDLVEKKDVEKKKKLLSKLKRDVLTVSVLDDQSIEELRTYLMERRD